MSKSDVYAGSETYVEYNCEMENRNGRNLAKRSRFHQAEMDVTLLKPGEDFPLEDGAVRVFLNTKGTNGSEVPETLVHFLRYVEDSSDAYVREANDPGVRKLHEKIRKLKASREWEGRYMRFEELLRDSKREGIEEGRSEGYEAGIETGIKTGRTEGIVSGRMEERERLLQLIRRMSESGEADQIVRLEREPEFLEEMLTKYRL